MKHIIHRSKHRFVVVLVSALVSFFGLQAVSLTVATYQIGIFWRVAIYVFLFQIFWQSFVFDLHLKHSSSFAIWRKNFFHAFVLRYRYMLSGHHFRHYLNYLILPGLIYWASITTIYLNPFNDLIKQVVITISTLALAVVVWHLKTVFYNSTELNRFVRQPLFLAKLYGGFISFVAAFGATRYFGLGSTVFTLLVFGITFVLLYQAFFRHHRINKDSLLLILVLSLGMGIFGFVIFQIWNVNYFSGAIVIAAVYNTIWGFVHHKILDRDLTREIALEYLAVLFIILVIIFSTTNFSQRIG